MLKLWIEDFLTIVGGCVGLGILFDKVLIDRAQKARLRRFLTSKKRGDQFEKVFYSYIKTINSAVFDRYFSQHFLSTPYFLNTVCLSLSVLVIVFFLQTIFHGGEFNRLPTNFTGLILIIACLFVNVVIDWVSIGQTQAFFYISSKLNNAWYSALLIFSDIILTINVFTLLFGQIVSYTLIATDLFIGKEVIRSTTFTSELETTEANSPPYDMYGTKYMAARFRSDLFIRDEDGNSLLQVIAISDSARNNLDDVLDVMRGFVGLEAREFRTFLERSDLAPLNDAPLAEDELSKIEKDSPQWLRLIEEGYDEIQSAEIYAQRKLSSASRNISYSVAYFNIDDVQDSFPGSISLRPSFLDFDTLIDQYNRGRANQNPIMFACKRTGSWLTSYDVGVYKAPCERRLSLSSEDAFDLVSEIRESGGARIRDYAIPLNTFFMTSLSMTLLIYAYSIFLIVSRFTTSQVIRRLAVTEKYIMRAPLALAGLVIGLVLFGLSILL